ncbi:hypothetical protein BTUL_0007g01040 [Botrytis tulipae]|uniref:Uncharacterized protein n=1 Tax=Botrytis tulipae TaxID=87230 RepID=A0A4Z1F383_9HELO|nr:hypothetical protein BTUL_0007g01040 [Botrytis tulipae]
MTDEGAISNASNIYVLIPAEGFAFRTIGLLAAYLASTLIANGARFGMTSHGITKSVMVRTVRVVRVK